LFHPKLIAMKSKFLKSTLTLLLFSLLSLNSQAASGIFDAYAILNINGAGNTYKSHSTFNTWDIGTFNNASTLLLNGGEIKTYKNSGSNVTGGSINYRIYKNGTTPGDFTQLSLNFCENLCCPDGNQKWCKTDANVNLLSNLTIGTYTVEIYWRATSSDGDHYYNNGGSNYKASFNYEGFTSSADGDWSSTSTWSGGVIPTNNAEVTLKNNLTLSQSVEVRSVVLGNSKLITLGNNNLTVTNISNGSTTSYIKTNGNGSLIVKSITSSTSIPVGNSTYNPITVANTSSHNWTVKVTDAITAPAPFNTNANSAIQRTWSITPSTNPTTATGITLQFDDNDASQKPAGFDINSQVQAFKRNSTNWMRVGSASTLGGSSGARTFTITGVTSFSDFGLTNTGSPLPVTFTSLTGTIRNGRANLNWNIADEHNVDRYEVEESANSRQFQSFTQVDAASRSSYQATDAQLYSGTNYYRVKAVDIDGKLTYSKIIRLENGSVDQQIRVYPNPSQGELTLGLNIAAGSYQIRVINAVGQTVYQQPLTHEGGSRSMPLGLPKLNAGIYQVEVRGGVQKYVRSIRID
jgi:hypothetical protein